MHSFIQQFSDSLSWENFVRDNLQVLESRIETMKQNYDKNFEEQQFQILFLWVKREKLRKLMLQV